MPCGEDTGVYKEDFGADARDARVSKILWQLAVGHLLLEVFDDKESPKIRCAYSALRQSFGATTFARYTQNSFQRKARIFYRE